jgi:hypothetical protein
MDATSYIFVDIRYEYWNAQRRLARGKSSPILVISSSANFDPAGFVLLLRVTVRPVNGAAFFAPFILAA